MPDPIPHRAQEHLLNYLSTDFANLHRFKNF